ncbi:MAG: penicillin-binding protein 2 [Oscillatoriales cyanobacterium SM2_3_0]|nr:penicillin-binding protein 2 [Oscillatoriales cyanobacterium SM2_3_0]
MRDANSDISLRSSRPNLRSRPLARRLGLDSVKPDATVEQDFAPTPIPAQTPFLESELPTRAQSGNVCDRQRLRIVWFVLVLGMLGLAANLFRLQVFQGASLKQRALAQQNQRSHPFVPRRPISDANGNLLALDQITYTLYAHPKLFKVPAEKIADRIAPMLMADDLTAISAANLLAQFSTAETGIKVTTALSEAVANRIMSEGIDGLELIQDRQRLYPQEDIAADVIGFVDLEGKGQAGVEYSQQDMLERTMPSLLFERAVDGTWVPSQLASGYVQLDDLELRLTLDTRLQRIARSVLHHHVKKNQAKRGTVIVMDAVDGSLLALANDPSYDPNRYYESSLDLFKNWALSDLYEPGSTFKPINVALALEAGAIQPETTVYDEGRIQIGKWPIENADYSYVGPRGTLSVGEVLKYSSNIGMVRIMQKLNPEVYYEGLQRLGLGEMMGVDLPFEVPSTLKSRGQFTNVTVEAATVAFGQGLSVTPVKLVQLMAVLANGGKLVTPHVVKGLYDSKGHLYWQLSLPEPKQVFSSQTTTTVLNMMETSVDAGTGKEAQIPGYRIAGKTGTAQKAVGSRGYSKYAKITSFVGILSVNHPRYVVLAVIDEPESGSGGTVAAPVVKEVMEALIGIKQIPPSNFGEVKSKAESEPELDEAEEQQ